MTDFEPKTQRALFIGLHQTGVANNVGREYGNKLTLNVLLAHRVLD